MNYSVDLLPPISLSITTTDCFVSPDITDTNVFIGDPLVMWLLIARWLTFEKCIWSKSQNIHLSLSDLDFRR